MYKFTKHDEPDIDKYEDRLRTNGCICYDYELMEIGRASCRERV